MISVIVPVYNGEKFLNEALTTIESQKCRIPIEIIVVDDGSTDKTASVASEFGSKIRYVYRQNGGIGAARNQGIQIARGNYLAFLDADDLWVEDKLERQFQMFEQDSSLDMVFGEVVHFFSSELDSESLAKFRALPPQMKSYFAGTMLIKRTSFDRVGYFSTSFRVGEYVDWYCRAQENRLKQGMVDQVVLRRRIHGANTTLENKANQLDYVRILHASLQRRRAFS